MNLLVSHCPVHVTIRLSTSGKGGLPPLKSFYTVASSAKANNSLNNTSSSQTQLLAAAIYSIPGAKGLSIQLFNWPI